MSTNNNLFQETLNLPQSSFPLRAQAQQKEPELLAFWYKNNIIQKIINHNKGAQEFILHDGPPYANGAIHMGHALNKILKDIVAKAKRQAGYHVPFVVGWDCHGLPIELKVATQASEESRISLKKRCRDYAQQWIDKQREEFISLGIFFDQEKNYTTMAPAYEASIVRALASFVEQGYIERKGKTVPWCPSCKTVLAVAEIEYKDRKDPSCFVRFELPDHDARMIFPLLFESQERKISSIALLAWTTTPWTLPLNRAVALNPTAEYVAACEAQGGHAIIVAADLLKAVAEKTGKVLHELCRLDARALAGIQALHPIDEGRLVPVIIDDSVTVTDGTAVLHVAPGCGPEDYQLALKHNLEIFSPLSDDGRYTIGVAPDQLVGMAVTDGQWWVLKRLAEREKLFFKGSLQHSYPHCWRCRQGLIFRATEQWFCNLQKNDLVTKTVQELSQIQFVPDWGKNRLTSFVSNRYEWCISRQRVWGAPIPALLCTNCSSVFITSAFVLAIAQGIEREGIEYWDRVTIEDLQKQSILASDFSCQSCSAPVSSFKKEQDILDVWFDSGISHYAVLTEKFGLTFPADLYLEGSDQHRGWFQSSLLCSMVLQGRAPYKQLLTHGFILDEQRRKMSKSLGNGIEPQEILSKYSRDILRLWVATVDYENDVVLSHKLLEQVAEVYRKIRNTGRFLLSNLYDFTIDKAIRFSELSLLDQQALVRLKELYAQVQAGYESYSFSSVVALVNNYCVKELSALYLDCVKDRLYCDRPDAQTRRAAQTALFAQLDSLIRMIAPILSFTAEELYQEFKTKQKPQEQEDSVHLLSFNRSYLSQEIVSQQEALSVSDKAFFKSYNVTPDLFWTLLNQIRDLVLKTLEEQRAQGVIKHSLEARIELRLSPDHDVVKFLMALEKAGRLGRAGYDQERVLTVEEFFAQYCIVSHVVLSYEREQGAEQGLEWVTVNAAHADGIKCPRCWQWTAQHNLQAENAEGLCGRCYEVIKQRKDARE